MEADPPTTRRRQNAYENAFLDWMREQKTLSSYDGWRCYDADGLVWNKNTKRLMLLETKTHGKRIGDMRADQKWTLEVVSRALAKGDEFKFVGCFLLTFENTSPADGKTWIAMFDGAKWIEGGKPLNAETVTLWFRYMLRGAK